MNKQCKACGRWLLDDSKFVCSVCEWDRETKLRGSFGYSKDMVKLHSMSASKAQLDELDRRVIIGDKPDGGYILGRRGENGKIQDKSPDYR